MPRLPNVIKRDALKAELSGQGVSFFLSRLGDSDAQDAVLDQAIQEAQSEFELDLGLFFTERVVFSRPPVPDTGYDVLDDAYPWFAQDFRQGGEIRLRRRPVRDVSAVALRYGGGDIQTSYTILRFPEQWIIADHRLGAVNIQPLYGAAGIVAGTLSVAMMGHGLMNRAAQNLAVCVNYTAGYLPSNFNAEEDDALDATYQEHDLRDLLRGVRMSAACNVLRALNRTVGAGGGSIGMDGLSQSFTGNRFANEIMEYQREVAAVKSRYIGQTVGMTMFVV